MPFLGKFGPKNQNYQFKLKFVTWTNSNMQNSIGVFIFLVFDQKCRFWANLVQKVKIISLSWNLVRKFGNLVLVSFSAGNTLFETIWSKKWKINSLMWNLIPRLIPICRIQTHLILFRYQTTIKYTTNFDY